MSLTLRMFILVILYINEYLSDWGTIAFSIVPQLVPLLWRGHSCWVSFAVGFQMNLSAPASFCVYGIRWAYCPS